ncbi:MAG: protein kinase domain-containing protein [Planctomycetota bacterium]|jgi:serine/threonine-protein kinase
MGVRMPLAQILVTKGLLTKDQAQEFLNAVAVQTGEARLVGGYEVVAPLGRGGMGAVYKAKKLDTGDFVALKILPPSMATERLVARFKREAEITSRLDHAHIVGCVEFGYDEKRKCHFCALEYIEGEDIGKRLERDGATPEAEAVDITRAIAEALQHAHANGLVHRDVKPANIMVTPDGTAKLLDLGLARAAGDDATRFTQDGLFVGSACYASPEQGRGESDLDGRSDIYSLGATLYHMVTGGAPFAGLPAAQVIQKHTADTIPWPAQANPDLSDGLCRVIARMMAKAPDDRYRDPKELLADLEVLREGGEPAAMKSPPKKSTVAVPRGRAKGATKGAAKGSTKGTAKHARTRARQPGHRHRKGTGTGPAARGKSPWAAYAAGGGAGLIVLALLYAFSGGGNAPKQPARTPSAAEPVTPPAPVEASPSEDAVGPDEPAPLADIEPVAPPEGATDDDDYFAKLRAASEEYRRNAAAAAAEWRTVCDGTSLDGVAEWSRKFWRVRGGALALDLSRAEGNMGLLAIPGTFTDVEVAVRFSLSRPSVVPHIGLGVRYAERTDAGLEEQYKASVSGGSLAGGEHELRIAVRGDVATSTIDGKPISVENQHSPREGRIQLVVIQTAESGFKIHSIKMREPVAEKAVGLDRGLVGHWKFDEGRGTVARDSSGWGNHGKIMGGAKWAEGRAGGAIEFDGRDDRVVIARPVQDDLTISMWMRTSRDGAGGRGGAARRGHWYYGTGLVDGEVDDIQDDFGASLVGGAFCFGTGNPDRTIASATTVDDGAWHHVAATRVRRTGALAVYVDGAREATGTGGTQSLVKPSRLTVACILNGKGYFAGAIDDVRVYDRALSGAEVKALFEGRVAPAP